MAYQSFRSAARGATLLAGLALAGCGGLASSDLFSSSPARPGPSSASVAASPPVDMAGRWRIVSASGGACAMTFTAPAGATEGAIAPEGGCPGNFYMSRRWMFEQDSLVIEDHNRKQLVQMKQNTARRFEGEMANRELVWLER